jgi:hypothetical protein
MKQYGYAARLFAHEKNDVHPGVVFVSMTGIV